MPLSVAARNDTMINVRTRNQVTSGPTINENKHRPRPTLNDNEPTLSDNGLAIMTPDPH